MEQQKALPWYKEVTKNQWKALFAAGSGWALDAMDVMLYSMILVHVMNDLQMNQTTAGFLAYTDAAEFCSRRYLLEWWLTGMVGQNP